MLLRILSKAALLACAIGMMELAPIARGQMVSITTESISDAADDLVFLVKAVVPGDDPFSAVLTDMIERPFRAVAALPGFDGKSPIRAIMVLPEDEPRAGPPTIAGAVRVTDFAKFMKSLGGVSGVMVDDDPGAPGFSHKITVANGKITLYALESKGHALFSMSPTGAERIKALKSLDLGPPRPEKEARSSILSLSLQFSQSPPSFRDQYVNVLEAARNTDSQRQPGESDAQHKGRVLGQNLTIWTFERLVRDGATLSLDFALDRKAKRLSSELVVAAPPATPTAKALAALKGRKGRFHVLSENAALALEINLPIAAPVRDLISYILDQGFEAGMKNSNGDEGAKNFLNRLTKYIRANIAANEFDMGIALQRNDKSGAPPQGRIVGAVRARELPEFDRLFHEFAAGVKRGSAAHAKSEGAPAVALDAARSSDGMVFHQVFPSRGDIDGDTVKYFGEKLSLCVAYGGDAIWYALGENSMGAHRATVAKRARPPVDADDAAVFAVIHVGALGWFYAPGLEAFRQIASPIFQGADAQHDRVWLGLREHNGAARLRLEVDLPAIQALVKLVERFGQ